MPLIVVPDDSPPEIAVTPAYDRLKQLGEVMLYDSQPATDEEFVGRIKDAEVVVNVRFRNKFPKEVLEQCKKLRLISVLGTGVDHIDQGAATKLGITVTNTPAVTKNQVAEHALTLMLCVARQIVQKDQAVKSSQWARTRVSQLYGKTLGLVGTGAIGQRTAQLGRGIGMKVIAWTLHPSPERAREYGVEFVTLDDLLKQSDVVSMHLRQSPDTTGIIGEMEFSLMKPTAILVNTARGPMVDEKALIKALTEKIIAGAGLDVFEVEPLPAGHPLTKLDNVVLTPHNATTTLEAVLACNDMTVDNIANFLQGKPTNVVIQGNR